MPSLVRNQTLRLRQRELGSRKAHHDVGGEIRRIELNSDADPHPRGAFNFTGVMTYAIDCDGPARAGDSRRTPNHYYEFADFLLGLAV